MIKRCPIMSKQNENHSKIYCFENECAWWDEEKGQCCFKTMALAAPAKSNGNSGTFGPLNQYIQTTPAVIPQGTTGEAPYQPPYVYCNAQDIEGFEPKLMPY